MQGWGGLRTQKPHGPTNIMRLTNRPYDDRLGDFETMWRFLQEDYLARQEKFVWSIGRLGDWKYGLWNELKRIPTWHGQNAQLWVDFFGRLRGFVLSENGDNVLFIITAKQYAYLYAEMLDWTIANWSTRFSSLKLEVHEYQEEALPALESRGFRNKGEVANQRTYDLRQKTKEPVKLPAGYRIVNMAENTDVLSHALLYRDGYEGIDHVDEFDLRRGEYSHMNPDYDPALDFAVITEEGKHVSACVGFADPSCNMVEVEKVVTHSGYRRLGLGEAVIRECFHRVHHRGIDIAYITGYSNEANGLYEKLGPCAHKRWFHYELPAPQ
jgi:ribosomal protein S18 acetylase RimI-like enzyme